MQYSIYHQCEIEVDPFLETQPVKYHEGVGHVVVAMKSKHQTSCSIKYRLEASLKTGRNSNKYEVAIVEPRMHQQHYERMEAVIGDILMQMTKLMSFSLSTHDDSSSLINT